MKQVRRLLARGGDPFTARSALPQYIRAAHFQYTFAPAGSGAWWERKQLPNLYVPALKAGDENNGIKEFLEGNGWV